MPEIEKICSVMITPPNRNAVSSAMTVTNGISALRNACLNITLRARHTLGPRGAHVVGVQHVEHRRALEPAPRGDALHVSVSTGSTRWRK